MKEQVWNVELEVLDNQMWCRAGQNLYEVVAAVDKEEALIKALAVHCLSRDNVRVIKVEVLQ